MHVQLVGNSVQLRRKILDGRLNEQNIRRASLLRLPVNLLGDLLERTSVRIYPDVKLVWVLARRLVDKAPVSRPDVDDHSLAGMVR